MDTDERINQLLDRWEELRNEGIPITPEDLCRDSLELLEAVKAEIEKWERFEAWRLAADAGADEPPAWNPGTAPVPGHAYRLERKLGEGSFGEVWRAIGPGGFPVAIKRILLKWSDGSSRSAGKKEFGVLEILKRVRHANLIALHAAFLLRGSTVCSEPDEADTLIIVMELATCSLHERWKEARNKGARGIPQGELLGYLREAAKALDFLACQVITVGDKEGRYAQHLDVKPGNLLLVGDAVAVADFGLLRLLGRTITTGPKEGTPDFMAPEVYRNQISRFSDQYSLAVTYCYLLTSKYPYEGLPNDSSVRKLDGAELTMLPTPQRHIVAKALSETPTERWPSCTAFVAELIKRAEPESDQPPSTGDPVEDYLRTLTTHSDDAFRRMMVMNRERAELHQRAYAKAKGIRSADSKEGIRFILIPPATASQMGKKSIHYPHELQPGEPPHFYISEQPISSEDWKRLGALARHPGTSPRNFRAVQAWLQAIQVNLGLVLRLPRPEEWRHSARLGLIQGTHELCADGEELYNAIYSGVPEHFHCVPESNPGRDFEADWRWRVVLE